MLSPAILVSFSATLVFIVAFRPLARAIGLVDRPGERKLHDGEIPIVGGCAIFLGLFTGFSLLPAAGPVSQFLPIAGSLLVCIGLLDDRFSVPVGVRVMTQITAVLIMVYGAGLQLHDLGDPFGFGTLSLGPFKLLMTVLVTISVINAFNLVDGADGLAGLLAIIALLATVFVSSVGHPASMIALITIAAIAAYLIFNFPVAANRGMRCFMGDAGSTLLGFIVVWVTISISQGPERIVSPVIGLWFASVPIYDLFTCCVRRTLKGHSPLKPGRDHFHHTLKRSGLTIRQVVGVLAGLQLLYASAGLIAHYAGVSSVVVFLSWSVLGLWQRWIVGKIAMARRLRRHRCRLNGETAKYARPGTF